MLIVSAERGHSQRPKSRTTRFEEHLEAQAMVGERVFSPPLGAAGMGRADLPRVA